MNFQRPFFKAKYKSLNFKCIKKLRKARKKTKDHLLLNQKAKSPKQVLALIWIHLMKTVLLENGQQMDLRQHVEKSSTDERKEKKHLVS